MDSISFDPQLVVQIQNDIMEEVFKAAKIPNIQLFKTVLHQLLKKPTRRFSEFIAKVDALIEKKGFPYASAVAINDLSDGMIAHGEESIPLEGPLIIASNHPGTYDGFAIISQLPRNDFKLMVSGIPFFRNLPNASKHLIYSTRETQVRMEAIRKSIRHLRDGGSIIIFPSGRIDPDPSILRGAEESLYLWSRSIEVFMKKVPETRLVLVITSGVLSGEFINHPFTKLFRNGHERRRIMEFMQVIKQMARGKPVDLHPKVTFASPLSFANRDGSLNDKDRAVINRKAVELLHAHMKLLYSEKKVY